MLDPHIESEPSMADPRTGSTPSVPPVALRPAGFGAATFTSVASGSAAFGSAARRPSRFAA